MAVLREPGFPAVDVSAPGPAALAAALEGCEVTYLAVAELDGGLSPERCDVFVSPYGSAVPVQGWPALERYLAAAGNWVNLGGAPCAAPVARDGAGWQVLPRADTYHKPLGIVLACAVPTAGVVAWRANEALPWAVGLADALTPRPATVWEPYYRLSSVADTPEESGSAGAREAVVTPLVRGFDATGHALVAPLAQVDRLEGKYAGGRWIFATGDAVPAPRAVRALLEAAADGAHDLAVRPGYACYRGRERPSVSVTYRAFPREPASPLAVACGVTVFDEAGSRLGHVDVAVRGTTARASGRAELGSVLPAGLPPGLYRVEARLDPPGAGGRELRRTTGFRVWDERLLGAGAPLGAGPFALTRGGEPFPVTGTTYMASDVHRKFLLQPNPWLWDRDFAAMRRAGVNLVRTGIWTGWKVLMPRPGAFDEGALRALDAWLLTARRHDVPVIFTLFAFLPETWGGENPYLDPAAVAAQRTFVAILARRYRGMRDLVWDLINEPSFCNKDHLWSCRPNYDRFERAAWAAWRRERGLATAELPPLEAFTDAAPGAPAGPPAAEPSSVVEYRLFAQAMFEGWVREMRAALAAAGNPRQLVTVGQDEAGTRDSPNNLFLAPALDFTCVHTWWLNDAVVWDEVMTRAPGKANLVEETGVMFSAHPPGVESRWEQYARDLLERKLAIALGPGGAGFVEWLWSSNCYMPSDNEAAIGLWRADGTAKPEFFALRGVAAFAAEAGRHLVGREREPVLMVVPHRNMFSTHNTATDATKRAVRAMQYGCRVGVEAVSEYEVDAGISVPRLVLVPAPRVLGPAAWATLRDWARRGARVLVTGPLAQVGGDAGQPVVGPSSAVRVPVGRGALLWSPVAVELEADPAATVALYDWALGEAGVAAAIEADDAAAPCLLHVARYRRCLLVTAVWPREAAPVAIEARCRDGETFHDVSLPAARVNLVLLGRLDGREIARYSSD